MRRTIPFIIMILLAVFVLQTAVRIEVLNNRAGNYLPRSDRNPDGTLADGEWRASSENNPRDQLRGLVQTSGLLQYVFAPLLLILALAVTLRSRRSWTKLVGALSTLVAIIAISLMLYRQYYQSLGW
jgi:hypothetical protein